MTKFNDTAADSSSIISVVSAVASISTTAQPIISAFAGIVAIISGLFAIRYYIKKTNNL
jgi:uncharacterized membrane-anchored protein